jgi:hypothetical protein
MNTTTIIGIVAGVVLVGGALYLMNRAPDGEEAAMQAAGESAALQDETAEPGAFAGSLIELAARGGQWKCTVDAAVDTGATQAVSSGVVYVSGENIRADFTSAVSGFGNVETHVIGDGAYTYTWTSLLPQGFKAEMTSGGASSGAATSGYGADANQSFAYECEPARADASLFVVPSTVTFQEI